MKDGTRSVKHKASLGRRILSATLAMVMCFSMMQVGAFAEVTPAQTQAEKQILGGTDPEYYTWNGEKYILDQEEKTNPEVSNNKNLEKVKISKKITATGEENVFDIHLKVETKEAIAESTVAPDAAVVLVIDASISMNYCPGCGQVMTKQQPHRNGQQTCAGGTLPLDAAQVAAYNFVRNYVGYQKQANGTETYTAPNAARYLSIVAYAKTNKNDNGAAHVVMDWIDLNDVTQAAVDAKLVDVKDRIDNVANGFSSDKGRYGTNSDAGLKLGQQMLTTSGTDAKGTEIADVGNKFLLFLTDGEPNANAGDIKDNSYSFPTGYTKKNDLNYDNPAKRANYIRTKLGAEFYSICFGAGDGVFNWMSQYSDKCVKANNSSELNVAFDEMIIRMQMAVDAWKVTDPMGQHISFVGVKNEKDHGANAISFSGNTLSWNLRNDLASDATVIKDSNGNPVSVDNYQAGMACTITYTLDYTVKLDVNSIINAAGSDDNAVQAALNEYYLTNGETKLVYYLTENKSENNNTVSYYVDNNGQKIASDANPLLTMHFKVPAVKGYAAKLGFTKVGSDDKLLKNAQFTLVNNAGTWSDAATSGADDVDGQVTGQVTFKKWIPSGDAYVLTETTAPSGYRVIDPVGFTLSYGEGLPAFNGNTVEDKLLVDYDDVTITKTWYSPDGQTPDSITVTLKQNGTAMPEYTDFIINKSDCTVSNNGIWSYTFKDLIVLDEEGNTYTYTVEENVPEGYRVEGQDSLNLINIATGKVNVIVTKEWLLPDTMNATTALVDVILKANGKEVKRLENVHDGETVSFMNLDQYDENGQTILYTVDEECDTAYQQVAIDKTAEAGPTTMYTIVNTVTDETDVTVSGTKIWKDGDDADGRPESITVALYADGNKIDTADVTAADNWQYSFTGLQRYIFTREGERITDVHEIVYTVEEVSEFDEYVSSVVGSDIINTRVDKVDFTVTKEWAADLSGAKHGSVTVILYANGIPVAESEAFEGSYTFEDLDKYDADGVEIEYYVIEVPVDGYTASYSDVIGDNNDNYTQTITNTRDDADDTLTITVTKVWQQPGDAETLTATFELYKGEEATGKTVQITGNGVGYFENLPRYEEVVISDIPTTDETAAAETVIADPVTELVEIDYNVREVNIPANYKNTVAEELTADSAGNFTCNFVNTITGTTNIFVEKSWMKPSNITAPEITVAVQKYDLDSGEWVALNDVIVIKSGETNGSVKNLPAYDADGRRISYRITELSVPGYSSAVNGGYNGQTGNYEYSIVNSINPSNSEITVMKQWLDGSRSAAERPSVTLQLLRDGEAYDTVEFWYDSTAEKVMATTKYDTVDAIVSEDGNTYSVKLSVPNYSADLTMKHIYSLTEQDVPTGYTGVVNGYTATNTRIGTLDIDVTKYWTDPGDVDRPDIKLTLTGKVGDAEVKTYEINVSDDNGNVTATMNGDNLTVNANGNTWTITADGLKQYHNGEEIIYTLSEDAVNGYTSETVEGQPFAINNVIVDPENVTVSAEKKWANMEIEGVYQPTLPDSITVALFRDGVKVEGTEQTVTKENDYAIQSYDNLEMYAPNGSRYSYQIMELNADGGKVINDGIISFGENNDYTVTYGADGTITNTFVVPVKYMWIVKTNYVHKNYDGTILLDWGTQTEIFTEEESKTITVDPADYAVCPQDNLTYQLDTSKTNVTSVELEEENQLYELVLNYILVEEAPYVPPYIPPYIPPVDPPVDPPQEPPVTPPEEPVITPEEPDVPAGDQEIDDPLHNLNDGDIPMEGLEKEDPNVPKTADESNVNTWILIALLSGMALAVSVLTERRQFKHKA